MYEAKVTRASTPHRILIVDDHPLVREGCSSSISVGRTYSAASGERAA